ncbi:hypothetical protein ACWC09_52380, partial [Streptomyces sp. NPDC001617]
ACTCPADGLPGDQYLDRAITNRGRSDLTPTQDCNTVHFPPTNPQIPNCPYSPTGDFGFATSAQYVSNSDPTKGALVSFDTQHGDFAVTGSYDEKLNYVYKNPNPNDPFNGSHTTPVSGQYTATAVWDGTKIQLLKIAGS